MAISAGHFKRDFAFICFKGMGRQVFHQATAFYAADCCAPAEIVEGSLCQLGAQRVSGIAPQVFLVIRAVHVLNKIEAFYRCTVTPD